jgi:transcriptional regulator
MLYVPAHYEEKQKELIAEVMHKFSFATIITQSSDEPFISHIPLLFDEENQVLLGHCARANPQWKEFADGKKVTVLFHGPHAYISPAWYQPKPDNVPTWNYISVHVQGCAELIEHPTEVYANMQRMVNHFETRYQTGWSLPEEVNEDLSRLASAIVVFQIKIKDIQAKFKLSQKQGVDDRKNVIKRLAKSQGAEGTAVAQYMNYF